MIKNIDGIIEAARGGEPGIIAVAAAHDRPVIQAVAEARREGIAVPVLVGHADEIAAMLRELGEDPAAYEIIPGDTDTDCAAKAVALCAEGRANFLMKGILGTADLMRAVFNKEHGLRTGRLTTHCMFYEIPALGRMIILTDGGVNGYGCSRQHPHCRCHGTGFQEAAAGNFRILHNRYPLFFQPGLGRFYYFLWEHLYCSAPPAAAKPAPCNT